MWRLRRIFLVYSRQRSDLVRVSSPTRREIETNKNRIIDNGFCKHSLREHTPCIPPQHTPLAGRSDTVSRQDSRRVCTPAGRGSALRAHSVAVRFGPDAPIFLQAPLRIW